MSVGPIRLLIADDHPVFRHGLAALIETETRLVLVAEAATGREALEQYRQTRPDIVLMDLQMPDMGGLDAIAAIRAEFPEARIVVLTTYKGDVQASRAFQAGAQVVAIGTGDERYAAAFVRDEHIPYTVLVDDHADAAHAASVETVSWGKLLAPSTWKATVATWRNGHKVHKAGKRVKQLGATFVIAPGDKVLYTHLDTDSTDHALADDVLAVLPT